MNKFFKALTTKDLRTENGMPTHSTSDSYLVDFFYKMGGQRSGRESMGQFIGLFYAAFGENPNLALKAMCNLRDIRGGMGERDVFKILLNSLGNSHPEIARQLVRFVPEFGRWDDLFVLLDTPVEGEVLQVILTGLASGNALCGKWMPRENKSEGYIAKYLMEKFGMTPREYRRAIVTVTESGGSTVETLMCRNLWENIKFQSVPGQAMKKYRKAFGKHQEERFAEYLESVKKGETKINTATLSPVQIVHEYLTKGFRQDDTLEALWNNLLDMVPPDISFLPICDLSGSMAGLPMEVSIALGIYLAQRNKSIFKNGFITFSANPDFVRLTGKTLAENMQIMRRINLAQNTDLEAVFHLILSSAVQAKLSPEDMPTHLMIISDMQFDQSCGRVVKGKSAWFNQVERMDNTALEMISQMYREAGYERPNIFFWNVSSASGVPAKVDDRGVGLISGFSPNLLKSVLTGDLNPLRQVEAILNNGRYNFIDEIV